MLLLRFIVCAHASLGAVLGTGVGVVLGASVGVGAVLGTRVDVSAVLGTSVDVGAAVRVSMGSV